MQNRLHLYKISLRKNLLDERQQWFLWLPVLYAIGILIYFAMPFEPLPQYGVAAFALLASAAVLCRRRPLFFRIILATALVIAGFAGANIRALQVRAPVLEKPIRYLTLQGKITEINTYKTGYRIILSDIKTDKIPQEATPEKIRLTVLTGLNNAAAGDIIMVSASLQPPPKAALPDAYDFAKYAYFKQIGAVGFTFSDIARISSGENTTSEKISQLRNKIADKFVGAIGGDEAQIAKALFIGDTGGIDREIMTAIRNAGLAHLLAISGLHLVLVCFIFFAFSRTLLAMVPALALNYNTKKIAAVIAIIGSYFYLLISGSPVSAERSFIMSAMVLLAMVLDRSGTPLRLVAIAAMFILLTTPENILSPSFQMSFGAVIALISAFEWLTPHLNSFFATWKIPRILTHIIGTIISSIIATIATAPFGIYHFNRSSPYGIIANIIAIPITSFMVMPLGVLAILLMPLHLEWLVAWPMQEGIDFIISTARLVAAMPYAGSTISAICDWQLLVISLGFMWLALWKEKWRLWGLPLIFLGVSAAFFNKTADVIIDSEAKIFAVKDTDGELLFSTSMGSRYAKSVWSARAGQDGVASIDKSPDKSVLCDTAGCIYQHGSYKVAFIKHPAALEEECGSADIFINLTDIKFNCATAQAQVNTYNLREKGTHEIFLDGGIRIRTVATGRNRIWE